MRRQNRPKLLPIVVTFALIFAACTAGGDDAETVSDAGGFTQSETTAATTAAGSFESPDEEPSADRAPSDLGSGGLGTNPLPQVDLGRDIIFTAQVTVAVADVASASTRATDAVQGLGGFLFGQQSSGGGEARSTLVFKIDPTNFQAALAALGELGEVRTQTITADDVTERIVDLESRISTAETSVERLQTLLAEAGDIDTIAQLESQLLDRETTLEVLRGQLRTIRDAVSLATITLHLTEALSNPSMEVQVTAYPATDDQGASCPGEGGLGVLEGEAITVCFEIFNTGDTLLTGFTLRDAVLDVEFEDLTVVWGDPNVDLEPGQSIVLSTELTVDRSIRTQSRLTAIPVNEDGQRVEAREVVRTVATFIDAEDPGGLPGFNDGLSASWDLLRDLGGLIVLTVGFALPLIWLLILIPIYRAWRRRSQPQTTDITTPPAADQPPSD